MRYLVSICVTATLWTSGRRRKGIILTHAALILAGIGATVVVAFLIGLFA